MDDPRSYNAGYIDALYSRWKAEPASVSEAWQSFFKGFDLGIERTTPIPEGGDGFLQAKVESLLYRYRDIGHLLACLDPLSACPTDHPLLNIDAFRLDAEHLDREFYVPGFFDSDRAVLREIIKALKETYCHAVGVEYMHIQDPAERGWLQQRMEPGRNRTEPTREERIRILRKLVRATVFEEFLNKKYLAVTRFSLEGGEAVIPLMDTLLKKSSEAGCREVILGMAHRGRLNVQAHILGKPYEDIFSEFENCYDPTNLIGAGDVKYHNGYLTDIEFAQGRSLRMYLVNNPSHLEAVNPVVEGFVRARQDRSGGDRKLIMPVLIHGDAAFAGQGVVAEVLNMSQLEGYHTGGTVHIVINNQIGYTTLPDDARSTRYSTDLAKMLMVPIFHVHGEDPEAVVHVAGIAADYRNMFHKDVVIDLICYRRYGHNEGDEPYFTQPGMYERIRQRPPLHRIYEEKLLGQKTVEPQFVAELTEKVTDELNVAYEAVHGSVCPFPENKYYESWSDYHGNYSHEPLPTGVDKKRLQTLSEMLTRIPSGFSIHPKLERLLKRREDAVQSGSGIDWANAESLAFASLADEGVPVRLSGQDVARGTFSQRHSVIVDMKTENAHVPLNQLGEGQAQFEVFNSLLSEAGVLGFEYGYSIADPRGLTLWEAQFGDFVNNAQAMIDLFIAAGESKWQRLSGLVLLLPHGWEGMGPEHSSAKLERFLQLCADDNLQVCNPSTPAQYFHLLRRQVLVRTRKPLVVMTPKSLLRHPKAVSSLDDLAGGQFREILDDPETPDAAETLLFCSGKIFYELMQRRTETERKDVAIFRVEQFYPFPEVRIREIAGRYPKAKNRIWVQEESENMGGWQFVRFRMESVMNSPLAYAGREAAASPATGYPAIYRQQQKAVVDKAFEQV